MAHSRADCPRLKRERGHDLLSTRCSGRYDGSQRSIVPRLANAELVNNRERGVTKDEAIAAQGVEIDRLCKMLLEREAEISKLRWQLEASGEANKVYAERNAKLAEQLNR